jgi:hypothetical protein
MPGEERTMGETSEKDRDGTAEESLLVTTGEAARLLGMDVRGFLRAVKRTGTLRRHPASGKFRFWWSRSAVLAWANEGAEGDQA